MTQRRDASPADMYRRDLLCSCCSGALLSLLPSLARAAYDMPARFERPDIATDEGGLWAMMDREEEKLRHSRFLLGDAELQRYVSDIACRLAGNHCPDMRVYLVRTPFFNASMAPNGMMQVWSGLLLRASNEAQLAAVLAHEVGHYLKRHSLERMRDARSKSALAQFVGMALGVAGAGGVGSIAQLGVLAGMFAFSRENEREADAIGLDLMYQAGYDPMEASRVWAQLIDEKDGESSGGTVLFATHPASTERRDTLAQAAGKLGHEHDGAAHADRYRAAIAPVRLAMLQDELRRRVPDSSLRLFDRLMATQSRDGQLLYARAEALKARNDAGDAEQAMTALEEAESLPDTPPEAQRLRGQLLRTRGDHDGARAAFNRYLELKPTAPDAPMMRSYVGTH
ncbi:M48 family metalloprotease [Methyloversatilis sp.]|uniref:M48 family metallopeptidase n=1 Tax=Methyloversatilis sp. TaxID=2569862 RepID=UPI003D26C129